jgi:hypothetical protein
MSPLVLRLINALHQPLQIIAQETLDRIALDLCVIQQVLASVAVPFTLGHRIKEVTAIAALVGGSIAQVAQDDQIIVLVLLVEADVAFDHVIVVV